MSLFHPTPLHHVVEQHILEHQSRDHHLDEVLSHAHQRQELRRRSVTLARRAPRGFIGTAPHSRYWRGLTREWQSTLIAHSGPMAVWDAIAQQIERLVERFEHRR